MHAVISAESSATLGGIPKGAMGLMQLMPGTAERFRGEQRLRSGRQHARRRSLYLRWLLDQFNDTRLAVAAYNAGEARCKIRQPDPPYGETQTYVDRVLSFYQQYRTDGLYYAAPAAARWH